MKRARSETSRGTGSDAPFGLTGSGVGTPSNGGDRARAGDGEREVDHPSSYAFEVWLAGYCSRLEQFVKNARRR
jgi:hypothetical protein